MILKMISQAQLKKEDRKKFIPFVNQRNHMGEIIKNKQKDRQYIKSIEVFENLKKTTKQFFFDKKYLKMKQKLQRYKFALEPKEPDYDSQIKKCFKSLQKTSSSNFKASDDSSFSHYNFFYVQLNQKLNQNISTLKGEIENNKKVRMQKTMNQFMKHNSVHNDEIRLIPLNTAGNSYYSQTLKQNKENQHNFKEDRLKSVSRQNGKSKLYKKGSSVNRDIFKQVSAQSQNMADFTNCGMKYKHLVQTQSKDPWRKWYIDTTLEIFPGQVVKIKKLQKSIYD